MYKEGIDYKFIDIQNSDMTAVELLIDNYEGVVYHYHKARIKEEGGVARLQFGYTLLDPGKHDIDDLNSNEEYHTIMGDILSIILMSKAKEDESFRDNNTKEFDLQ
jgi:hypothetical protein